MLGQLREAISPDYLALIANTGQPITVVSSRQRVDNDAMAALAASAFAATRQMADIMAGSGFSLMLSEGAGVNISIARVTEDILLIISFSDSSEIGRVRLVTRPAIWQLAAIFNLERKTSGAD